MRYLLLIISFIVSHSLSSQPPVFIRDSLDAYIKRGLRDWQLPGLSIVVIKDGKTVLMKGYGVKDIDTKAPVDENTLFMIASNTKLFTGTLLALLENRDKMSLNDKVTKYFPEFRLYDTISSRIVTVRDMLTHRIGTKTFQGDFTFWNTTLSRQQVMQKMRANSLAELARMAEKLEINFPEP